MITRTDLARFAAELEGAVVAPEAEEYLAASTPWNVAWTHRPAAVARPRHVDDVVRSLRFARRHDLAVAVQSTGHGVTVPADEDSLLLDVSGIDHVTIDPVNRTATVGGGVRWTSVLEAAQRHGLAPLLGSAPHVGAVGYTLGGGFGWLARKHGLAVDSVVSLRIVLADGRPVTASPEEDPELFWALCGAGAGTLGVVVAMTVALAPVTDVYAGNLLYPLEDAQDVFAFYREWSDRLPVEMTGAFNVTAFPPLPVVPEALRGKAFAIVRGCHCGDLDDAAALLDEWRAWRAPAIDMFGPMPFTRCAEISQDPVDPVPAATTGRWLADLPADLVDTMVDAVTGGPGPSPVLFAEARKAGGAVAEPNPEVSFAARGASHSLELVGLISGPDADTELETRFGRMWDGVTGHLYALPGYLNFTEGQERIAVARQAFGPAAWDRLAEVKHRVDPGGVFRHSLDLTAAATPARAPEMLLAPGP